CLRLRRWFGRRPLDEAVVVEGDVWLHPVSTCNSYPYGLAESPKRFTAAAQRSVRGAKEVSRGSSPPVRRCATALLFVPSGEAPVNGAPWSEPLAALIAERTPSEVPAPRDSGCDLHVESGTEPTLPLDHRSRAVDPDEAWCPRVGGDEIVNDEGDLVVPALHV